MNTIEKLFSRGALADSLTTGLVGAVATPAYAHETDCPCRKLKVVQNSKDIDNEVVRRNGNFRDHDGKRCHLQAAAAFALVANRGYGSSAARMRGAA